MAEPFAAADKPRPVPPARIFGFWDVTALIVGIVVGTAIFKTPAFIFQNVHTPWQGLAVWGVGGLLSLCGALCYAELATSLPRNGGDYEYLGRAYWPGFGFLFGWAQWTAVLSGSIAAMAYAFGDYAVRVFAMAKSASLAWALAAVAAVTILNLAGARTGSRSQNLLSLTKIIGLLAIIAAGFLAALFFPSESIQPKAAEATGSLNLGLAMVFVLYAFGGWNDAAFVAAEVRNPQRNLPAALLLGTLLITLIYLAVNWAILAALGWQEARQSLAPAADVMRRVVGPFGERLVSCLVAASALGAIHGMILSGARVNARLGADTRLFARMGHWNTRTGTPIAATAALGGAACLLLLSIGTQRGQALIDRLLAVVKIPPIRWEDYSGGFEVLVMSTAPVFWAFFLLSGAAVIVLRIREPALHRPFRTPLYPLPVLIFCASSGYMLYASVAHAGWLTLIGVLPVSVGVVVYHFVAKR
jgi:amino acid transporter